MNDPVAVSLRMPRDIKEWLVARASRHLRSQNSELIVLLQEIRKREDLPAGGAE